MIYIGDIPQSAKEVLKEYIEKFFPDEQIEDITDRTGVKGLLRSFGGKSTVKLIVLGKDLYDSCYSAATEVLSLSKVHKYLSDEDLRDFLIDNFGDINAPPSKASSSDSVTFDETSLMVNQDEYEDLESQLEDAKAKLRDKENEIKTLKTELQVKSEVQTGTIGSPTVWERKCHDLEVELTAQQEVATSLNNELFSLKGKASKYDILVKDLASAQLKIEGLEQDLETAESVKSALTDKITELNAKINNLETTVISFEHLKSDYSQLQSEKANIESKLTTVNALVSQLQDKLTSVTAEYDKLKQELAGKEVLEKRLSSVETDLETALQRVKTLTGQLDELEGIKTQLTNVQIELDDITVERNSISEENDSLRKDLSAKDAEIQGYLEANKVQQEQIAKQKVDINSANSTVQGLKDTISEKDKRISELSSKNSEQSAQIRTLQADNSELVDKLSDAENDARTALSKAAGLDAQLRVESRNTANLQKELDNANQTVSQLSEEKIALESKAVRLQSQTESYKSKLETANNELSERDAELKSVKDMIKVHEETIESLNSELDTQTLKIRQYKEAAESATTQRDELKERLSTAEGTISDLRESIGRMSADNDEKDSEMHSALQSANDELSALKEKLKTSEEELTTAQASLSAAEAKLQSITSERDKMVSECISLKGTIDKLEAENKRKDASILDKNAELQTSADDSRGLQLRLDTAKADIKKLQDDKEKLNAELVSCKGRISELETYNNELKSSSTSSSSDVITLTEKIKYKDEEITRLNAEADKLAMDLRKVTEALEAKTRECSKLTEDITKANNQLSSASVVSSSRDAASQQLQEKVSELEIALSSKETLLKSREAEITSLNSTIRKCTSELDVLKDSIKEDKDKSAVISDRDTTISELRKSLSISEEQNASLAEELAQKDSVIEQLKESTSNNSEVERLSKRVFELESEAIKFKASTDEIIGALKTKLNMANEDLVKTRKELSHTESVLVSRNEELSALSGSVFTAMSTTTLPKSVMNLSLTMPMTPFQNIYVFSCGSNESSTALYKLLRRQVESRSGIKHIIVDLTMDSSIDRELGLKSAGQLLKFLQGEVSVANSLSETKYSNCSVMTTAMSYINDLYLLTVDWGKRLAELSSSADIVIVNIGSLGNVVSSILYNSLTSIMRGIVVVKATQINIRTALLKLTGFQTLENTIAVCTDYTESSKTMYEKLQSKFQTRILSDTEVLSL